MHKLILSLAMIGLLSASACGTRRAVSIDDISTPTSVTNDENPSSDTQEEKVTLDISPTLETNDAVVKEVEKLQEAGTLTDVTVRESFPVQITATGSKSVLENLQKMAAGEDVSSQSASTFEVTQIEKKSTSRYKTEAQLSATTEDQWKDIWVKHNGSEDDLPEIDFTSETVLAVFMGQKGTGGYSIAITSVELTDKTLTVMYTEEEPAPGSINSQALTAPAYLGKVNVKPSQFDKVEFQKEG